MARYSILKEPQVQAAFDFLPSDIRHDLRFGSSHAANLADFRAQSRFVDRQVAGLVSRIAAARLREVLAPTHNLVASNDHEKVLGTSMEAENTILDMPTMVQQPGLSSANSSADHLSRQRDALRETGAALFYFRDEVPVAITAIAMTGAETTKQVQRLHPRPLPARYYDQSPDAEHKAA